MINKKCEICGKEFLIPLWYKKKKGRGRYCSIGCSAIGRKKPPELLLRTKRKCKECQKGFFVSTASLKQKNGGTFCSRNCAGRSRWKGEGNPMSNSLRLGEKNPNWKGGSKKKYSLRFGRKDWKKVRTSVLEKDDFTCQTCGSNKELVVHHITPYRITQDNSFQNLIVLCNKCHPKVDSGKLKIPFIGVAIPTRGLIHSRTIESLMNNLKGLRFSIKISHDLPIPDCHNFCVDELLKSPQISHLLLLEEDMLLPDDTIAKMVFMDCDVVSVDYADRRTGTAFMKKDHLGNVVYTGVGCMLVKREVFKNLRPPYFREGLFEEQDDGTIVERPTSRPRASYGTQDVYFCNSLTKVGYSIDILESANIGHLQIEEWGADKTNKGSHKITAVYIK